MSRRYRYRARLFTVLTLSPIIYRFALVAGTLFETDAARRSFGPGCTVPLLHSLRMRTCGALALRSLNSGIRSAHMADTA
eukprot:4702153-Pleurochrysis_carterae.AAC.1